MIELAASVVLLAALGALVDRACFAGPCRGAAERLGRAWMLGFGTYGALSMALDVAGLGVGRATVGVASALLAGALLLRVRRAAGAGSASCESAETARSAPGVGVRPGLSGAERAAVAALVLVAALASFVVVRSGWLRPPFQFDALTRWMFKTKALHVDGTLFGSLSFDEMFWFTHQRYPPLVSHVAGLPSLLSDRFDGRIASAVFPWFAVAITLMLGGTLARVAGPLAGAAGAAWFSTLPLIAWIQDSPPGSGAFSALADVPLSLFLLGATLAAWETARGGSRRAAWEAGLLLGFAALTKNEGQAFLIVLPLAVLLSTGAGRLAAAGRVLSPAAALYLALWGLRALEMPALDEHYSGRLHVAAVREGIPRIPRILAGFGGELVSLRNWNLSWPAVAALLLLAGRRCFARGDRLLWLAMAGQLGAYAFALLISRWSNPLVPPDQDPVDQLMYLTLGRLLLHVAPIALFAALFLSSLGRAAPEPAGQR